MAAWGASVRVVVMRVAATLMLLATLSACTNRRAASDADPWYAPPPSDHPPLAQWEVLDQNRVRIVLGQMLGQATELLEETAWMPISPVQAQEMTGLSYDGSGGFYLVRGLYLNWETGGFTAHTLDGQLWIVHRSLGAVAAPVKRQPLVVQLDSAPAQVHVTCSVAE